MQEQEQLKSRVAIENQQISLRKLEEAFELRQQHVDEQLVDLEKSREKQEKLKKQLERDTQKLAEQESSLSIRAQQIERQEAELNVIKWVAAFWLLTDIPSHSYQFGKSIFFAGNQNWWAAGC